MNAFIDASLECRGKVMPFRLSIPSRIITTRINWRRLEGYLHARLHEETLRRFLTALLGTTLTSQRDRRESDEAQTISSGYAFRPSRLARVTEY